MRDDSERLLLELAEQDRIQQQIRCVISSFKTVDPSSPRRKGAAYASFSVSSGKRCFNAARRFGFTSIETFRREASQQYRRLVLWPNIRAGARFGEFLRSKGFPLTIVPGQLYNRDWTGVHYMATWRPVIMYRVRTVAHDLADMGWTIGGVEEYKIGIQCDKRILFRDRDALIPADLRRGADVIRHTVDRIAGMGFDPQSIYEQWQQIDLLIDNVRQHKRHSVMLKTA